ncbi:MAG: DNA repair protein RadC [Prevotella sp.]|nr:DNA repair protein RadC [Prevotella sp.]MCF0208694.1 DNA repair protein RadC [Bacteroidaceae bacterium]
MVIKEWSPDDRPRERLAAQGAEALSNAELLAILIGSGSPAESAVELMKRVLADVDNNLNRIGKMSIHDLCQYNGIGPAKAITILAAVELGRRRQLLDSDERLTITTSEDIFHAIHPILRDAPTEEAWVFLLNHAHKLIKKVRLSHGGLTETLVDIRVVVKEALLANATTIALCHNHPSGNCKPSRADDTLTKQLNEACRLMRIHLIDHLIVVESGYFSYADEGRL